MTSTNKFSSWELLHELDTPIMSNDDISTFGNVGEVMPQTMTPLTTSTLIISFERGLLTNFPISKPSKHFNQLMAVSHHRLALNVFSVFLRLVKPEISIENRAHGIAILEHEFVTDEIHKLAKHRYGIASKFTEMRYIWNVIKAAWVGRRSVADLEVFMGKFLGTYNEKNLRKISLAKSTGEK